jgi:hypothetical protein
MPRRGKETKAPNPLDGVQELKLVIPEALEGSTAPTATEVAQRLVKAQQWRFHEYDKRLRVVLPAVKNFCMDVLSKESGTRGRWLTILGPSGIGKTLILQQAFQFLRMHWMTDVKTRWPDGTKSGRTREFAHVIPSVHLDHFKAASEYAKFDLIYVEDIGAGEGLGDKGAGKVTRNRLAELMQLRTGKFTLADANLTLGEVATQLDPRIASRLKRDGSILIELSPEIPDYNFQNE